MSERRLLRRRETRPGDAYVGPGLVMGAIASGNPDEWQEGYEKLSERELVAAHKLFGVLKDLSPRQQAEVIETVKARFGADFGNPKKEKEVAALTSALAVRALAKRHDLEATELRRLRGEVDALNRQLDEAAGEAFWEGFAGLVKRAKDIVQPPATSAGNVEVLAMSWAYWLAGFRVVDNETPEWTRFREVVREVARVKNEHRVLAVAEKFGGLFNGQSEGKLHAFCEAWMRASYARLEVGHRLAASLCLTDVPDDVSVKAPWPAWSLVVPDGLLGDFARIWCLETEPAYLVGRSGAVVSMAKQAEHGLDSGPVFDMVRALIRGACLALSNPEDFRKEKQHAPTARSKGKSTRSGPPDLQQARFMLSAPVKVDLREHVRAALSDQAHASPTVQFLVRGHWRNQSYGPKHSLRRVQWIEPFWKGPEESRILLRQHSVEEPSLEKGTHGQGSS